MLTAKGRTGIVTVDESFITIERKGAMAKLTHGFTQGQKRIAISQVTSVQFKKPGLAVGYIQFTMAGANESKGGALKAVKDENSVAFEKNASDFEAIRDFVEAKIAARFARGTEPPTASPQQSSVSEQIRELAALREDGLLSEEEFASQKAKLLNS